jgi:hypothetical protein
VLLFFLTICIAVLNLLQGLLYLLMILKNTPNEEKVLSILLIHEYPIKRRYSIHSLFLPLVQVINTSPWSALQEDLQNFNLYVDSNSEVEEPYYLKCLMADSQNMEVLKHQLTVLKGEYPLVPFEEALNTWGDECRNSSTLKNASNSEAPLLNAQFIPLLLELVELENSHATAVAGCRTRDGMKGRSVIPDYDLVNVVGSDTFLDPTVKESCSRVEEIAKIVYGIINEK